MSVTMANQQVQIFITADVMNALHGHFGSQFEQLNSDMRLIRKRP